MTVISTDTVVACIGTKREWHGLFVTVTKSFFACSSYTKQGIYYEIGKSSQAQKIF